MNVKVRNFNSESFLTRFNELTDDIINPKLILFFASQDAFSDTVKKISEKYPASPAMGTVTNSTYSKDTDISGEIQITFFMDNIECSGNVIPDIKSFPLKYAQRIQDSINSLSSTENTICLSFTTAFSNSEELVITALDTVCSEHDIKVVGGTAGIRNETGEKSYVSLNGKIYEDSAVYMCIRNLSGKIHLIKENIFIPTKKQFFVNRVDIKTRTVFELNQKPCAKVLSETLNTPVSALKQKLDENPIGRIHNNEICISAIENILPDNSTVWGTRIYSSTKVTLLKLGDYKSITENTINKVKNAVCEPEHVLMIHCDARRSLYEKENFLNDFIHKYTQNFKSFSGFSSHGEQLGKMHLNFTLLLIAFE